MQNQQPQQRRFSNGHGQDSSGSPALDPQPGQKRYASNRNDWQSSQEDLEPSYSRGARGQGFQGTTGYNTGNEEVYNTRSTSSADRNWEPSFGSGRWEGSQDLGSNSGFQRYNDSSVERDDRYNRSAPEAQSTWDSMKKGVKNFFGKGPKGYKRSDERIKEEISEALYRHPRIDASEIEVDVKDATVTLRGTVEERRTKRLVEDVTEDCAGVSNVINQLMVASSTNSTSTPLF